MTSEQEADRPTRKLGICDVCGYRIQNGIGVHNRCETEDEDAEDDPRAGWPECDRHGRYQPGEHMCPDCFDNARAMGCDPLGGRS